MVISAGIDAPDFRLLDETGAEKTLSEYLGKPVVLYFYPKDDTPGCTTEACNFRDDYSAYEQAGVVILGVSPDSPKKHTTSKGRCWWTGTSITETAPSIPLRRTPPFFIFPPTSTPTTPGPAHSRR